MYAKLSAATWLSKPKNSPLELCTLQFYICCTYSKKCTTSTDWRMLLFWGEQFSDTFIRSSSTTMGMFFVFMQEYTKQQLLLPILQGQMVAAFKRADSMNLSSNVSLKLHCLHFKETPQACVPYVYLIIDLLWYFITWTTFFVRQMAYSVYTSVLVHLSLYESETSLQ